MDSDVPLPRGAWLLPTSRMGKPVSVGNRPAIATSVSDVLQWAASTFNSIRGPTRALTDEHLSGAKDPLRRTFEEAMAQI